MAKGRIEDYFILHTDFYDSFDMVPICGTYITDNDDRILAQFWLANPNLRDKEIARRVVQDVLAVIEAKLRLVKLPRRVTEKFLADTALNVVSFLTAHIRESEEDLDQSSLIPAPLWAPQDVYRNVKPPGDDTDWEVEEW